MDKSLLRNSMILKRRTLSKNDKVLFDMNIFEKIKKYLVGKNCVGVYVSTFDEIDTINIIKYLLMNDIKVCVPKVYGNIMEHILINTLDDLKIGAFNILEPTSDKIIDSKDIDLIIVPLLAFDQNLYRIGYGKGYYDRYLELYNGYKIGLAYDFYLVEDTCPDVHDISLDLIITSDNEYGKL